MEVVIPPGILVFLQDLVGSYQEQVGECKVLLTVQVSPLRGLPGSLWTLLTHVESLTSHFDREDGVCMGIMGVGLSHGCLSLLVDNLGNNRKKLVYTKGTSKKKKHTMGPKQ